MFFEFFLNEVAIRVLILDFEEIELFFRILAHAL